MLCISVVKVFNKIFNIKSLTGSILYYSFIFLLLGATEEVSAGAGSAVIFRESTYCFKSLLLEK